MLRNSIILEKFFNILWVTRTTFTNFIWRWVLVYIDLTTSWFVFSDLALEVEQSPRMISMKDGEEIFENKAARGKLTLEVLFFFLLRLGPGSSLLSSSHPLFWVVPEPLAVRNSLVLLVGRDGLVSSLVILRRESDPENTNPGDGCCGYWVHRVRRSRAGVDGGISIVADDDWITPKFFGFIVENKISSSFCKEIIEYRNRI